jgi:hypothetical protein
MEEATGLATLAVMEAMAKMMFSMVAQGALTSEQAINICETAAERVSTPETPNAYLAVIHTQWRENAAVFQKLA